MEIVKCPACGSGDVDICKYQYTICTCKSCGHVFRLQLDDAVVAKNATSKEVDFTGRSKDFKMGYAYGVRDGENREWERRQKMANVTTEKSSDVDYPQDAESNEYRYLSPAWLDAIATGLTAGAVKHPGETWRQIPAREHAWRAVRHLILVLKNSCIYQ